MKNKILNILEKPKIVIGVTLLIAVVIGIFAYKFLGYAPKSAINAEVPITATNDTGNGQTIDLAFPKSGKVSAVLVKPGDLVKKGQVLANLDFADVGGALEIAKANYQKVLNGATSTDIDVAKAAVQTAQTALDQIKMQQDTLVVNAKKNLLNSSFIITTTDQAVNQNPPTVSGTYLLDAEGQIIITEYDSSGGVSFQTSGIVNTTGTVSTQIPQPIGDTGLYIIFPNTENRTKWILNIPDQQSPEYLANFNAYQSALSNQAQAIANATASLNQAESALTLKQTAARPEDVASALGALRMAQGAYDNDFIYAPYDGIITAVNLSVGEIAPVNGRVISMIQQIANQ